MKKYYSPLLIAGLAGLLTACAPQDKTEHNGGEHQMAEHQGNEMHKPSAGHEMTADKRMAVQLSAGERQHVLMEMRGLLQSTQGIIEGLAKDDMELVQKSALAAGTDGRKTTENMIMHKKMPQEWMQLGGMAHKSMDEIAQMAADGKSAKDIQLKLVSAMDSCTACHAAYQLPNP